MDALDELTSGQGLRSLFSSHIALRADGQAEPGEPWRVVAGQAKPAHADRLVARSLSESESESENESTSESEKLRKVNVTLRKQLEFYADELLEKNKKFGELQRTLALVTKSKLGVHTDCD